MAPRALLLAALIGATLGGCTRVGMPPPLPPPPSSGGGAGTLSGWIEEGIASWYGEPYHGRRTASGEVYDMEAMTAAHRTLPFGTVVLVENLQSGHRATLRINDRGPFIPGRTIDVSRRAARELALIGPGTARVRVSIVEAAREAECWEVQTGGFASRSSAEGLEGELLREGHPARVREGLDGLFRVWAGPLASREEAGRVAERWDGLLVGCALAESPWTLPEHHPNRAPA